MGLSGRRGFLATSGALLAAKLARADSSRPGPIRTIGYLHPGSVDPKRPPSTWMSARALKKLGWVNGESILIEYRFAERRAERLAILAEELVRKRVEIIMTYGSAAAVAAARATRTIPIVFMGVSFPVELELVQSLARPGHNVTGSSTFERGVIDKRFEFLQEIAPTAKRVALCGPLSDNETVSGGLAKGASDTVARLRTMGFEPALYVVRRREDVDHALDAALKWGAQALNPLPSVVIMGARQRIVDFARKHHLPCISAALQFAESGGLLSYGVERSESDALVVRAMEHVDRILRGADPAELPVEKPRKYELVVNLKTANELGLTIPPSILLRADRVIE